MFQFATLPVIPRYILLIHSNTEVKCLSFVIYSWTILLFLYGREIHYVYIEICTWRHLSLRPRFGARAVPMKVGLDPVAAEGPQLFQKHLITIEPGREQAQRDRSSGQKALREGEGVLEK